MTHNTHNITQPTPDEITHYNALHQIIGMNVCIASFDVEGDAYSDTKLINYVVGGTQ